MSFLILENRPHRIVCQAVFSSESSKPSPIVATHPTTDAEPENSLPILENRPHIIACQAVSGSESSKPSPIVATHPAQVRPMGEPEVPIPILKNLCKAPLSDFYVEGGKGLSIIPAYAVRRVEPEMSLPILKDRRHPIVRQAVLSGEDSKLTSIVPAYPSGVAEPEIPLPVQKHWCTPTC